METNNINHEEKIEWGGWLNEFLWKCAGVNRKILRQCPTDYAKYAGIGGTILFTSLMAMMSGGYVFYLVFKSIPIAIVLGIFWGLLIFNLDRFIVNKIYSNSKIKICWRNFYIGLPSIIIGFFLGIVISIPLEMKIFEERIDSQLVKDKTDILNGNYENGFLVRYEAFSKVKQEESAHIASLFITILIIINVIAPTFFKMMIASGPYDDLIRAEMHKVRKFSDKIISNVNDDKNKEV